MGQPSSLDTDRGDRELVRGQTERLASEVALHPLHFKENPPRLDHRHPHLRRALALSHSCLRRFLGERLIRENSDPHLSSPLQVAGQGDTGGLDLPRSEPASIHGLQPVVAKGQSGSAQGHSCPSPLLLLPILYLFRLQHLPTLPSQHRLLLLLLFGQDLTPEDRDLNPDNAIGRLGLAEAVANIGAQGMQGHPAPPPSPPARRSLSWPGGRPPCAPPGGRRFPTRAARRDRAGAPR